MEAGRSISGLCDLSFLLEVDASISDILYFFFGQSNYIFIREKSENFENWCLATLRRNEEKNEQQAI